MEYPEYNFSVNRASNQVRSSSLERLKGNAGSRSSHSRQRTRSTSITVFDPTRQSSLKTIHAPSNSPKSSKGRISARKLGSIFQRHSLANVDTQMLRRLSNDYREKRARQLNALKQEWRERRSRANNVVEEVTKLMLEHDLETPPDCLPEKYKTNRSSIPDENIKKRILSCIPAKTVLKCKELNLMSTTHMMGRLLRPLVFLEVELQGVKRLGQIIIELCSEACPQVVLKFARKCAHNRHDMFQFTRSFPLLWMEAKVREMGLRATGGDSFIASNCLDYDMSVIDHDQTGGVVSFPARHANGFANDTLVFSLSYGPLPSMNGKRIAFGTIVSGQNILNFMQDMLLFDNDCGNIFVVTQCGLIQR